MTRNGFPSTPSNTKGLSAGPCSYPSRMIVLSIPAPWMVMAFILAQWPVFHPFVQTAVPAGSWTVSPSLAASIASQTASGVKAAAVRVSARRAVRKMPSEAPKKEQASNKRNPHRLIVIIVSPFVDCRCP